MYMYRRSQSHVFSKVLHVLVMKLLCCTSTQYIQLFFLS